MELRTHKNYNPKFGRLVELKKGYAKVILKATEEMAVDKEGLIHGGFTFSAADFCAMATVNEPFVVLAKSESRFLAPVKIGDEVVFESEVIQKENRKWIVKVKGRVKGLNVFEGLFKCVVLDKHILS